MSKFGPKHVSTVSVKNFLKSDRHTHKDPEVRIASLDSMDSSLPENQLLIEQMATSDDDESVRLAAVNNLSTVSVLQRIVSAQTTNSTMVKAVESRIGSLLSENTVSESEAAELLAKQPAVYAPLLAIHSANAVSYTHLTLPTKA